MLLMVYSFHGKIDLAVQHVDIYLHSFSISKALALRLTNSNRSTSRSPGGAGSTGSAACLDIGETTVAVVAAAATTGLAGIEDGEHVEESWRDGMGEVCCCC